MVLSWTLATTAPGPLVLQSSGYRALPKKWPNAAILMELSLQLHVNQTCLAPAFIHREHNDWSDQLSKGDTSKFNPMLQVQPVESFIILNDLLKESLVTEA